MPDEPAPSKAFRCGRPSIPFSMIVKSAAERLDGMPALHLNRLAWMGARIRAKSSNAWAKRWRHRAGAVLTNLGSLGLVASLVYTIRPRHRQSARSVRRARCVPTLGDPESCESHKSAIAMTVASCSADSAGAL